MGETANESAVVATEVKRPQPVEILLVEDNSDDVRLIELTLRSSKVVNNLHVVDDGVEAIEFLNKQGNHTSAPRPGLVLLDLMLPRKSGLEVLAEVRADERFSDIPIVVLTQSKSDQDLLNSYGLKADCFLTKPFTFDQLLWIVDLIEGFGLEIVSLDGKSNR